MKQLFGIQLVIEVDTGDTPDFCELEIEDDLQELIHKRPEFRLVEVNATELECKECKY